MPGTHSNYSLETCSRVEAELYEINILSFSYEKERKMIEKNLSNQVTLQRDSKVEFNDFQKVI